MRAIIQPRYGPPESVRLADVPAPSPGEGEALVRVHASSVNSADVEILTGWWMVRMASPLRPAHRIVGSDVAGVVESVGPGATDLGPGDEVVADLSEHGFSAFAEYVAVPTEALAPKPSNLTFEQAAAVPSAAWVAVKGMRKRVLGPQSHVLVNGAGGGMGTFAVQMAVARGARVTGVDRADKLELIRSLGAVEAVDYQASDPTRTDQRYDLVLDVQARRSVNDWRRVLAADGTYLMVGGSARRILQGAMLGQIAAARSSRQTLGILPGWPHTREDMDEVHELVVSGAIRPIIDRTYPLAEAAAALRHVADGRALGKVVVGIAGA